MAQVQVEDFGHSTDAYQDHVKMQTLWHHSTPIHPTLSLRKKTPESNSCATSLRRVVCSLPHRCGKTPPINSRLDLNGWAFCHQTKFLPFSSEKPVRVGRSCLQVTVLQCKNIYIPYISSPFNKPEKSTSTANINEKVRVALENILNTPVGRLQWLISSWLSRRLSNPRWGRICVCILPAKQEANSTLHGAWIWWN